MRKEDLLTCRPRTRFSLYRLSGSGTTVTTKQGINDGTFSLASSAFTITPKQNFRLAPFVFTSVGSSVAGGYATSSSVTATSHVVTTRAAGGSAGDGLVNVLCAGFDTNLAKSVANASMPIQVSLGVDLDYFHIKGTGTAAIVSGASRATLTDNGTGNYTLTLKEGLRSNESVVFAQAISSTCAVAQVDITNATTLACKTYNASGSAADADFYVFIFRPLNSVGYGRARRELQVFDRGVRAHLFQIDVSGGTPALTYGPRGATITDEGTGDYTVTLPSRLWSARNPVALIGGGVKQTVKSVSASTVRVASFNAAGSAADPSVPIYGLILAFNQAARIY